MKKHNHTIAFILSLVMMFSMSPVAFASNAIGNLTDSNSVTNSNISVCEVSVAEVPFGISSANSGLVRYTDYISGSSAGIQSANFTVPSPGAYLYIGLSSTSSATVSMYTNGVEASNFYVSPSSSTSTRWIRIIFNHSPADSYWGAANYRIAINFLSSAHHVFAIYGTQYII